MKLVKNKLSVNHYPQLPCEPFQVQVKDEYEALKIKNILADQHNFLFTHNIIPDYSNAIIILMWDETEGSWIDYYNSEEEIEWDEVEDIINAELPQG